ncbi:MAG: hypothetical protein KA385_14470 [Vicinamibacteria bacterium]|nr:hypothetical protein [Vicinamibacteria bacterium]
MTFISLAAIALLSGSAAGPDISAFWKHWGDGKAEVSTYRLTTPRYGEPRQGQAVLIYVTEDMSESQRVKAEPGRNPAKDVFPALKLNHIRSFQTGIYDYRLMTSTFVRVAPEMPVAKISFTSQEWCGQVYHQLLPRGPKIESVSHSYFDGEADAAVELPMRPLGIFEDQLFIMVRQLLGEPWVASARGLALLPSLWSARGLHKPLAWTNAQINTRTKTSSVKTPAGTFEVVSIEVMIGAKGAKTTFDVEATGARRIIRWKSSDGEEAEMIASKRLPYWQLNSSAGETELKGLGLKPVAR